MKKEEGIDVLLEAFITGDPDRAILNRESHGQQELVNSTVLPKKFNFCSKEQFEQMGIVYGEDVDDLFVEVTLPAGWKKEATNHSMWSKLMDEKGRERASIFYRAAFYDRDAHINITQRFHCMTQPVGGYGQNTVRTHEECVVTDCGKVVWKSGPVEIPTDQDKWLARIDIDDRFLVEGKAWLEENYPGWDDPAAYWD